MRPILAVALALLSACARPHAGAVTQAPLATASYLDLAPGMRLRIENAYWEQGSSRRGLNGYLGTEIATFGVRPNGSLRFVNSESKLTVPRPKDQPSAADLLPHAHLRSRYYRLYYAVKFSRSNRPSAPVLLGARSRAELNQLGTRLADEPDQVCRSGRCTVFPESGTVSAEMVVTVNGTPQVVLWGSTLASVTQGRPSVILERAGVRLNVEDFLRMPLQPYDQIRW